MGEITAFLLGMYEDQGDSSRLIFADYLEENFGSHPEIEVYIKRLRNTRRKITFSSYFDFLAKFGSKNEKYLSHKWFRKNIRGGRGLFCSGWKQDRSLIKYWADRLKQFLSYLSGPPSSIPR